MVSKIPYFSDDAWSYGSICLSTVVRATTSVQDHVRVLQRQVAKTFTINGDSVSVSASPDGSEVVASLVSPSGKYLAVLREATEPGSSDKRRYAEVWTGDKLYAVENVSDKHGQFYTDGTVVSIVSM